MSIDTDYYSRLRTHIRLDQQRQPYEVDDCDDMLKADQGLLGAAMQEFSAEVLEDLNGREFVELAGKMFADASLPPIGTPQYIAARMLLKDQVFTLFETIARQRLAQVTAVQAECMRDGDPTPWCSYGHPTKASCDCGPLARND